MDVTKIVITGGPCAGKTTALSWIMNSFTEKGYVVLIVPETATELINGGVAPWTCKTNADYQFCQMRLQLEKEKVFEQAARVMKKDKVLIVCDRGALDNKVYMDDETFEEVLRSVNVNEVELRDSYDAIFHLVTAAKGAEEFYTLANNKARTEGIEEAATMDDKFIAAWTGHPHLRVIDNSMDFTDKMKRLIAEIASFLGEPEPLEIERNFLVEYPDLKWLESLPHCEKVEIIQTYLKVDDNEEIRVRQRGSSGHYIYYQTTKRRVSDYKRIEIERRITKDEYLNLLMNADTSLGQIRKDRYCLTYNNQYFKIDVYPFWNDKAIMEIELRDINDKVTFPEEIKIIKEVTKLPEYKNSYLAKHKPE
ncbi:MAG: AAA family ATPase [Lachnospiraceae bacterium]|nr:AAA family ATPase [Lachnospiraceae bacterium]